MSARDSDSGCMVVYMTFPDRQCADGICRALVQDRLAACANILDGMTSLYWWKDVMETATECAAILKTTREKLPAFTDAARSLHPYEVPCIVSWPIESGLPDYLQWIFAQTRG